MATSEALKVSKARGLDLVQVSDNVTPPICRIVDYGKYKYDQKKKKKEHPKKTHKIKEVKFRVGIDPHDYEIKMTRAEHFLDDGDKLRVQLMFRGREMAHQEIGYELMEKVKEDLHTMAHVDMEPRKAGRNITMMLSPLPEAQRKRKFTALNAEDYEGHEHEEDHDDHEDEEHLEGEVKEADADGDSEAKAKDDDAPKAEAEPAEAS